ncbi:MAG: hypothetical protein AB8B83_04360 [Bdellovibrionales bacterium]
MSDYRKMKVFSFFVCLFLLVGCLEISNDGIYTLYRNSPLDNSMRIHIATFDSKEGGRTIPEYNQENCLLAASLFNDQRAVSSRFWCEKGKFRI